MHESVGSERAPAAHVCVRVGGGGAAADDACRCRLDCRSDYAVEVAARVGRVFDEDGVVDPAAIDIAENVLKVREWVGAARTRALSSTSRV